MEIEELAEKLREMYCNSKEDEKVAMIHLFGIRYERELRGFPSTRVARKANLRNTNSYHTEISKGRKLAKYVDVKQEYLNYPSPKE